MTRKSLLRPGIITQHKPTIGCRVLRPADIQEHPHKVHVIESKV